MLNIIVTTSRGLDELLQQEINAILFMLYQRDAEPQQVGKAKFCYPFPLDESHYPVHWLDNAPKLKIQPGQVSFEGDLKQAYAICLHSRLANRVLVSLAEGKVHSADDLYNLSASVDWPSQFSNKSSFSVQFNGTNKAINNSQFGALKVKDAIVDAFVEDGQQRPNVERQFSDIKIHVRVKRELCDVCIDLSGQSLHQRGYRMGTGDAPIKEHLAAAVIYRSGWHPSDTRCLLDPMCGSGTIAIEAALMANNIAPNLLRKNWGFESWFGHQKQLFDELKNTAHEEECEPTNKIYAFDLSTKVLDLARENAYTAGLENSINFKQCDVTGASVPETTGVMVSNPPYGERLDDYVALLPMYHQLGEQLKREFGDWRIAFICSSEKLLKALKLRTTKKYKLFNGKIETQLALYDITDSNLVQFDSAPKDNEFSNRLSKNLKKLKSWIKRSDTDAYRVYDADLPNFNFAIDLYGKYVIVQEYAAPKNIPESVAQERLAQALLHLPSLLNCHKRDIVLKVREKKLGKQQYEKVEKQGKKIQVHENGATFLINPTDYLDVGLFLDHRITRKLVKQKAKDKHVLNLFCYTGSVSVHAALGGAKSVTSVDMSNTYLNWAKENFDVNGLKGPYEFIKRDCIEWINETHHAAKFDLIFIDPPSFSNSKRMEASWDVQRDHLALLQVAKSKLNSGGIIFFSNNLRSFKLDEAELVKSGFMIKNITSQTIDEDFKRNQKIHHCWELRV